MAQEWLPPALTLTNVNPPLTATGVGIIDPVEPLPSWDDQFAPQQYAVPVVVMAQVCCPPALIWLKRRPPVTGTGTVLQLPTPRNGSTGLGQGVSGPVVVPTPS